MQLIVKSIDINVSNTRLQTFSSHSSIKRAKSLLDGILGQHVIFQRDELRARVGALPDEPEDSDEDGKGARDQRRVVHRRRSNRHREGEAEDDDEDDNPRAGDGVDDEARGALHPEVAGRDLRALGEEVRQDGGEVGERGEDDEGADERAEGRGVADVDASQERADDGAGDDGVEGVLVAGVDAAKDAAAGDGVVARHGPEDAAGGEHAADDGDEGGEEGDDEEAQGAAVGTRRLTVDLG